MEIPAFAQSLLQQRVQHEANISDSFLIKVQICVVGWEKEGGGLWWRGDLVYVYSPMLIMQRTLRAKSVTFFQDSGGGTRTELELVNPIALNMEG